MLSLQSTFEKLISSLLDRLQEVEYQETDLFTRLEKCIRACEESLQQLRQWLIDNPFPDKAAEICFFKQVKSVIVARYIYYHKVYRLHIGYCNGSALLEKERLQRALQEIDRFFADNKAFYEYYRTGDTHYDELYFLRKRYDWRVCPDINHFEEEFSTSGDRKLAELMANELLANYVNKRLNPEAILLQDHEKPILSTLPCAATSTDIVELAYAFFVLGICGNKTIKEVIHCFAAWFHVDVKASYNAFNQLRNRKINKTKFLDRLRDSLHKYMEQLSN